MSHAKRRSSASATSRHETKQARPCGLACLLVVLPGIEPAPENALNRKNIEPYDAGVRPTTRKHLREREVC